MKPLSKRTVTHISLVFADLVVDVVATGYAPFVARDGGPDFKTRQRR
jgi:hypothetical protein